jgi:hypothetical protein
MRCPLLAFRNALGGGQCRQLTHVRHRILFDFNMDATSVGAFDAYEWGVRSRAAQIHVSMVDCPPGGCIK